MTSAAKDAVALYFEPVLRFKRYLKFSSLTVKERIRTILVLTGIFIVSTFFIAHMVNFFSYSDTSNIPATVISKQINPTKYFVEFQVTYKLKDSDVIVQRNHYERQWNDIKVGEELPVKMHVMSNLDRSNGPAFLDFLCVLIFSLAGAVALSSAVRRLWIQLED